jgi:glutathione S-transferase
MHVRVIIRVCPNNSASRPMLTIHHAPGTRGFRVIWLCEELALPYALRKVDFSAAYRASEAWRRMNPVGKVPVMTADGVQMFESGAMLQYLLERHAGGRLQPPREDGAYGIFLQWCWFAEATFGRATGEIANHKRMFADAPRADAIEEMRDRARACVHALEPALAGKQYLLGELFTAADVMMGYTLASFQRNVGDALPASVAGYWARLQARTGYQRAIAAEGRM